MLKGLIASMPKDSKASLIFKRKHGFKGLSAIFLIKVRILLKTVC